MEWKISDVLAILTLAGAVVSFSVNAYKDREIKKDEHADKVRATAAQLLGKTNALHDAVPTSVLEAQQRVVEAKLKLLEVYEPQKEMHALWGTMLDSKSKALQRIASLQTDSSYLAFYTFSPNTKKCIDAAIAIIAADLRTGYVRVLSAVEKTRLALPKRKEDYVPAWLYNEISAPLMEMETVSSASMQKLLGPIEKHLLNVIGRANEELIAEKMQREPVACG
jgi:hypothetical protein